MARRRVLLLLKPFDMYPIAQLYSQSRTTNPKILQFLDNRRKVHREAVHFCQSILQKKAVDWEPVVRANLCRPIQNVDFVITVGGDGTLLQASHFMDDSIPVLGVNSDPTQVEEVEEFSDDFDATRSTGYLCGATTKSFEQVLDDILESRKPPSELRRISLRLNSQPFSTFALNDVLMAHPCPATVSRFSFRITRDAISRSPLAHCRSSGLRVSTAAGSTAAMLSAGGFAMPILSQDLQYMVREPISPAASVSNLMQGIFNPDQVMEITWYSEDGFLYVDGSNVLRSIQYGDRITMSSRAPNLKVFFPEMLQS
ncbi:NADH kinase [Linum grandiflorum]